MQKKKPTFKEIRRLTRKLKNTCLFVPSLYNGSFYNLLRSIWMLVYFAFYCKGRPRLYYVNYDKAQYMTREAHKLLSMSQLLGWIEVRPLFSNEVKSIVTMTIEKMKDDGDMVKMVAHLELYKKEK